jgi:hypothetical protein
MKRFCVIILISLASLNIFAQDSTNEIFYKNILSAGLSTKLIVPLKPQYNTMYYATSTTFYFSAGASANIDYSIIISNKENYAFGIDFNAEYNIEIIDDTENGGYGLFNGKVLPVDIYTHKRFNILTLSTGLNYYRKLSSNRFAFFNLSVIPFNYQSNGGGTETITDPITGNTITSFFKSNGGNTSFITEGNIALNYKMGLILPFSNYKIIPFIETPILAINSSPYSISWFNRYGTPNYPVPFLEISIGCNIIF